MNNIYTINLKGLRVIRRVLEDCHINYNRMSDNDRHSCSMAYASDAETSANSGDSVAVFEVHRMQSVNGFTQAYTLDLVECFDIAECEE